MSGDKKKQEKPNVVELPEPGEMTAKDFADVIRLARSAPIPNMDEAEARGLLLQRFAKHAEQVLNNE